MIRQGDVVDVAAEAIVFSTNEHLFLSGGAGASLLGIHGRPLQDAMDRALARSGRKVAPRGSVFEIEPAETWSFRLFAVVAANGFYETCEEDTRRSLAEALALCGGHPGIKRVVTTALGTGYGNMEIEDFISIFCRIDLPPTLETVELVIHSELFFKAACARNMELGNPATLIP